MGKKEPENILSGREPESELDIERYRKYFDILRRNDAPIVNEFPYIKTLAKGLPANKIITVKGGGIEYLKAVPVESKEEAAEELRKDIRRMVESWTIIKNIYDGINLGEQDENTGRAILQENKDLINRFHSLFMEVVGYILQNPELPPNIPRELFDLRARIFKNAIAYGELPAVRTYENIGREDMFKKGVGTRYEWFKAGKPTSKKWFKKWFGSEESREK